MANGDISPEDFLKSLGEQFKRISFGGGVVGKTAHAALALCAVWGGVVWRLSESPVMDSFLMLAGAAATAAIVWWIKRTHQFAEQNPIQAMLSGAQFVEYQKFEAQMKGALNPPETRIVSGAMPDTLSSSTKSV